MLVEILTDFFDFNGMNKRYSAANSVLVKQIRSICTIIVHFRSQFSICQSNQTIITNYPTYHNTSNRPIKQGQKWDNAGRRMFLAERGQNRNGS